MMIFPSLIGLCECGRQMKASERNRRERERHKKRPRDIKEEGKKGERSQSVSVERIFHR